MNKAAVLDFLNTGIDKIKIAVIGDMMLDRYYFGEVKRISPEAPVPIAKIDKMESCLGGAANVANNLAHLGAKVYAGGPVGADENCRVFLELMRQVQLDTSGIIRDEAHPTITKLRVLGAKQQMLRLDFEHIVPLNAAMQAALLTWLEHLLGEGLDGIILSDYGKGVCTPEFCRAVISRARSAKVPIMVDPKGSDWSRYAHADYITPNVKEMGEAVSLTLNNTDDEVTQAARQAGAEHCIANVVVTRSEQGVTLVGDTIINAKATAREVFDVSGAGDTMAAALMAGIAGGLSKDDAVRMSNAAAGIVVGKVGTKPVLRSELIEAIRRIDGETSYQQRIMNAAQAKSLIAMWQAAGKKVIFTNGCFDILHIGHVNYLADARRLGDKLVVGLNSDESVRLLKGLTRPLVDENARAALLASLSAVNLVVIFPEETPERLLSELRPDVLVKGGDYKAEEVLGREFVKEVKILPFVEGYSTTNLVNKIAQLAKDGLL